MTDDRCRREEWIPAFEFEGYYEVSNLGNLRNAKTKRLRKFYTDKKGYLRVHLTSPHKKRTAQVHRIIMQSFKGDSKLMVDHINTDKQDNRLSNLEYVTARENSVRYFKSIGKTGLSKAGKKFGSQAYYKGETVWVGSFDTRKEAVEAAEKQKLEMKKAWKARGEHDAKDCKYVR